eukprot:RCo018134
MEPTHNHGSEPVRLHVVHLAFAFPHELPREILKPDVAFWVDQCIHEEGLPWATIGTSVPASPADVSPAPLSWERLCLPDQLIEPERRGSLQAISATPTQSEA